MDTVILLTFAGIPLVGLTGFLLSKWTCTISKACLAARFQQWSLANITGVFAACVSVLLISISSAGRGHLDSTGNASGMAMFFTMLFASYKFGFHDIVRISREAAWRIHYTLGLMTLVIGFAHLVLVFDELGARVVFGRLKAVFGLVGLVLMFMGTVPAKFLIYDHFKVLHFLSFIGLLFTVYHMVDAALLHRSLVSIVTAVVNCVVLLGYLAQRIYIWVSSGKAVVKKSEVSRTGHIFLYLSVPGFKFQPGQWSRLYIPSISAVAHPFTLIPANGRHDANVAIFMKVSGEFTTKLASALEGKEKLEISLQPPYGRPCPMTTDAVIFVLGGVGVTPALSLLPAEAAKGKKVSIYWSLRSQALCQESLPFFQHLLDDENLSCVKVKDSNLVQQPESIPTWLEKMAASYDSKGLSSATIFVCGPASMAEEVRRTLDSDKWPKSSIKWQLHVEEFQFLPKVLQPDARRVSKTGGNSKECATQAAHSGGHEQV